MPKLLQINSVVNYRSTGSIVEEIGRTALSNRWESYVAFGRVARPGMSEIIRIGNNWDILLQVIETRLFDRHGLGSKKSTLKIIEQIKMIQPDIIHLHNLHGYYINIEVLFNYLTKANIPIIWTLHDCWAMTGHCAHFDFIGCEKWKTQCYNCPQKSAYPSSFGFDSSRNNYNIKKEVFTSVKNLTIVTVSRWLSGKAKQSYFSKYPIQVINNGIDLNIFSPQSQTAEIRQKYDIGNRFMLMGVSTAWSERKGLEDYVKLSKVLTKDFIIVLVGLSNEQLKTMPKTIIGIARTENIIELSQLYSTANIILNLSAEETFGLTTVEGFACGTPSIVYNCTASPELITPETGYVIEKGDIQGLIHAINIILKKGKSSYSSACRDRAEKLYNKNDRYQEYINLYESLLIKGIDETDINY
jgi:glycosyltransferase involved in cell wall biosynthesis